MKNTAMLKQAMTAFQYQNMVKSAKHYMMRKDLSLRENLAQFYMEGTNIEDQEHALIVADKVLRGVSRFEELYDAENAGKNPTLCIANAMNKLEKNYKTDAEKCLFWIKVAETLPLISAQLADGQDRSAQIKEIDSMTISNDAVTPDVLRDARKLAREAMQTCGLMSTSMRPFLDEIKAAGADAHTAQILFNVCNRETEFRALTAMAAYMQVKQGFVKQLRFDLDAEQVTMIVCAKREQFKILAGLNAKKIAQGTALALLTLLGAAVMAGMLVVPVGFVAVALADFGLNELVAAAIPTVVGCVILGKGVDLWREACNKVVTVASAALGEVVSAAKKLFGIVAPKVVDFARNAADRVRCFFAERAQNRACNARRRMITA